MLIAVDVSETRDYTLKVDQTENPTVFQLGVIDSILRAKLQDMQTSYSVDRAGGKSDPAKVTVAANEYQIELVKHGLRGWSNFKDKAGKEIPFDTVSKAIPGVGNRSVVSDNCMRRLRMEWIAELADELTADNTLSEEDVKNSDGPSSK